MTPCIYLFSFVNDAFPGVVIILVLFVFPAKNPLRKMCSGRQGAKNCANFKTHKYIRKLFNLISPLPYIRIFSFTKNKQIYFK